jgi:hypothetical protein
LSELEKEDEAIFNEIFEKWPGVLYEPYWVSTQVVAGTNYCFAATATPVDYDGDSYDVLIYIFVDLEDNAFLVQIVEFSGFG